MTVHESSPSPCVHAILAARLGMEDKAVEMYLRTARLTWTTTTPRLLPRLVHHIDGGYVDERGREGFGGFRVRDGIPYFNTMLPSSWKAYAFKLRFRDRLGSPCRS